MVEVRRKDVVARSKGDVKFRQGSYLEARGPGSGIVGALCCREVGGWFEWQLLVDFGRDGVG